MYKKIIRLFILVGFVSSFFLVACGTSSEIKDVEEVADEIENESKEVFAEEEDRTSDLLSLPEYYSVTESYIGDLTVIFNDLTFYTDQVISEPSVAHEDNWINDVEEVLDDFHSIIEEVEEIEVIEEIKLAHDWFLKAMDQFKFVVDNYIPSLQNRDYELLDQCIYKINTGMEYIHTSKDMLDIAQKY